LLPRALDVLFNSIQGHRLAERHMIPQCFSDAADVSDDEFSSLCALKESIVDASTRPVSAESGDDATMTDASEPPVAAKATAESDAVVTSARPCDVDSNDTDTDEISGLATDERVVDDTVLMVDAETEYEVYVSYAEVYNEQVTSRTSSCPPPPAPPHPRAHMRIQA
jgi:hypothetical protein